jgi:hypothetical protein
LGGVVLERENARRLFTEVHSLAPDLTTPESARKHAGKWLRELARRVAASQTD